MHADYFVSALAPWCIWNAQFNFAHGCAEPCCGMGRSAAFDPFSICASCILKCGFHMHHGIKYILIYIIYVLEYADRCRNVCAFDPRKSCFSTINIWNNVARFLFGTKPGPRWVVLGCQTSIENIVDFWTHFRAVLTKKYGIKHRNFEFTWISNI